MTEEERYLFDLQGYLVLRGVLPHDFVSEINRAVDELESLSDDQVTVRGLSRIYRNAKDVLTLPGEPNGGLPDYDSQILPYGGFAEELIDWPTSLGYVQEMIGEPCRMDAASLMSRNTQGAFKWHHGAAELLPYSEYAFRDGGFKCVSVKIGYALTDVDVGDGCFAVIAGSHKSNFTNPLVGMVPDAEHPLVRPIPVEAGDAVIFSEDLSHGAVVNRRSRVRRTLFYSYAPVFHCKWNSLAETAHGFEKRSSESRRALIEGPSPYADENIYEEADL